MRPYPVSASETLHAGNVMPRAIAARRYEADKAIYSSANSATAARSGIAMLTQPGASEDEDGGHCANVTEVNPAALS